MSICVTVSGSFHRHMQPISDAVFELQDQGVKVLSPNDPRVVDQIGLFLFVASDRHRSVRLVQDRHLAAIKQSNFLWLVCPDGYVGQSASMEIGFAVAESVPIFSRHLPNDLTLRQYVQQVESVTEALKIATSDQRYNYQPTLLVDPHAAIRESHKILDEMGQLLLPYDVSRDADLTPKVRSRKQRLDRLTHLP